MVPSGITPRGRQLPTDSVAEEEERLLRRATASGHSSITAVPPGLPELTFLPTVDKLTSVHALSGNKSLFPQPIVVRVSEHHAGKRSPSARVMKDLLHHTLDIAMALSIVQGPKLRCSLTMFDMCSKHTSFPLTLTANHPAHLGKGEGKGREGRGMTLNNTQLARN